MSDAISFSAHALRRMLDRGLDRAFVATALNQPTQLMPSVRDPQRVLALYRYRPVRDGGADAALRLLMTVYETRQGQTHVLTVIETGKHSEYLAIA